MGIEKWENRKNGSGRGSEGSRKSFGGNPRIFKTSYRRRIVR